MRGCVGVVLMVGLLGCGQADAVAADPNEGLPVPPGARVPDEGIAPAFVVSSDPAEPIIRIRTESTFVIGVPSFTYTLFGDGRLELAETPTRTYNPPRAAHAPRSVDLDAQELHSLAALAAARVLMEGDPAQLASEFEKAGAHITDGSVVEVEIHLASYSRGSVNLAPVERRFRMVEPTLAAKFGFGGEAVQTLAAVVNGVFRTHKEKDQ